MAKKRNQFMVSNIHIDDCEVEGQWLVFDEKKLGLVFTKSNKVLVSENRIFRKFCFTTEIKSTLRRTEDGRIERDEEGTKLYDTREVNSAQEFLIINLANDEKVYEIKSALAKGIKVRHADGTETVFKRLVSSASQTRVGKRLFTSLDVDHVREKISFGAKFTGDVVIAQVEARYGMAESSTMEITEEDFTFDVMPDYEITRKHDVTTYDWKKGKLNIEKDSEKTYTPLDGQGTILPSASVRIAFRLFIVSKTERDYLLEWLEVYNEDVRLAEEEENEVFLRLWKKIPSAFQIRFGFTKGLILVYAHNLESMDCNKSTYRTEYELDEDGSYKRDKEGNLIAIKAMKFFKQAGDTVIEGNQEHRHYYDFSKDIMFTDSQWKENFDPKYITKAVAEKDRAKLEIVLWQKNRQSDSIFMGYQYWQSLKDTVSPKEYADTAIAELSDTIFTDADHAKAFLGLYDTGSDTDEYGEKMSQSGGKIQRVLELLNEKPELMGERYVQDTIRKTREKYISDMANGRIPVKGVNPYVVSSPEVQFGNEPILKEGEYYYNGLTKRYAGFRSPLIDESEAVVINTIDAPEYHVFNQGILIMNVFDDICPRMGGMDTDGDKIAMVEDDNICDAVHTDLPMLYDKGEKGGKEAITQRNIWKYDVKTIINDVLSIGEITNMATTWKDILNNPRLMKKLNVTRKQVKQIVQILRFMQGWSIDYAKTGFFPDVPSYVLTSLSPEWKPWSRNKKDGEVFKSSSPLGQLNKGVKEYMTTKFKQEVKEQTADFTFEFTAGADMNEVNRIKPVIKEMELNYRHELSALRDMNMTKEEESEYVIHLMDKYSNAVQSIDSDIRSIASAAYLHTYFESSSKGKSISFPWITAYEGLLLNIADSADVRTKLRKAVYHCHIDDVPATLKFYRNESIGDGYEVSAKVPNGTYETFRHHGQLFVKMSTKSIAKTVEKRIQRPVDTHVTFEIKGFKYADVTPQEIIDLLKENDGLIRVEMKKDNKQKVKELRAVVFVGDRRIGVVGRNNKAIMAPLLAEGAVELRVENVEGLKAEYLSVKKEKMLPVTTFNFDMVVVGFIEVVKKEEVSEDADYTPSSEYYEGTGDEGYVPEETLTSIEMDFDEDDVPTRYYSMESELFNRLSKKASYWNVDVDPEDFNIIGASIVTPGSIGCADIKLYREDGKNATVCIDKDMDTKELIIVGKAPKNEKFKALVLQVAHYEMYVDYLNQKQA